MCLSFKIPKIFTRTPRLSTAQAVPKIAPKTSTTTIILRHQIQICQQSEISEATFPSGLILAYDKKVRIRKNKLHLHFHPRLGEPLLLFLSPPGFISSPETVYLNFISRKLTSFLNFSSFAGSSNATFARNGSSLSSRIFRIFHNTKKKHRTAHTRTHARYRLGRLWRNFPR